MQTRRKLLFGLSASALFCSSGILSSSKTSDVRGDVDRYAKLYKAHRQVGTEDTLLVYVGQDVPAMKRISDEQVASILSNCNTKIFMRDSCYTIL